MSQLAVSRKDLKLLSVVIAFLSFLLLPTLASAQDETASPTAPYAAIAITPTSFQVDIKPGESVTKEFRLRNAGEYTAEYTFSVADISPEGETGDLNWKDPDVTDPHSLANWFNFDRSTVVLAPHEAVKISVNINAPVSAEPGGHYGTIFATGKPVDESSESTMVYTVPRLAVNFLATVPGNMIYSGELLSFEGPAFANRGPIELIARFKNTGTVHQRPKGSVIFYDIFGQKVGEVMLDSKFCFPNSIRQLPLTWDKILLIGRYRAVITLQYGENFSQTATAETMFWALPWQAILGGVAVITILFGLGRLSTLPARKSLKKAPRAASK